MLNELEEIREDSMKKSVTGGFMRNGMRALVFVSILVASAACASADTTWNLVGVNFSDGATATGFFTVDSGFDALTNWDITVSGSDISGADFHYTFADSNYYDISPTEVGLASSPFVEYMLFLLPVGMTNAGGTLDLATGDSVDCNSVGVCGGLVGGEVTAGSVPEPASILTFACGAFILGLALYRRRQAAADTGC